MMTSEDGSCVEPSPSDFCSCSVSTAAATCLYWTVKMRKSPERGRVGSRQSQRFGPMRRSKTPARGQNPSPHGRRKTMRPNRVLRLFCPWRMRVRKHCCLSISQRALSPKKKSSSTCLRPWVPNSPPRNRWANRTRTSRKRASR